MSNTQPYYDDWPYHIETELDCLPFGTELSVSEDKRENGLDYVSKSRIKLYEEQPFEFFCKYWCEERGPPTYYTEKGSQIHKAFEVFHENLIEYVNENGLPPDRFTPLMPDDFGLTSQWLDYIGNFWKFEMRRWQETKRTYEWAASRLPEGDSLLDGRETTEAWTPEEVEAEFWLGEPPDDYDGDPDYVDSSGPPVGDIPWMGKADVVLNTASVPGISGSGVVILDYKTGTCPTIKYDGAPFLGEILEGLWKQTEYYGWMAEHVYDIDGAAIYYPAQDELLIGEYGVKERRYEIMDAATSLQEQPEPRDEDGVPPNYPLEDSNLIHYGDGCSWYYNLMPCNDGAQN